MAKKREKGERNVKESFNLPPAICRHRADVGATQASSTPSFLSENLLPAAYLDSAHPEGGATTADPVLLGPFSTEGGACITDQ